MSVIRRLLIAITLMLAIGCIFFAKAILLPFAMAFMLTLTLSPVVRLLVKIRISETLAAGLIMVTLLSMTGGAIYGLSGPVSGWISGAPEIGRKIERKLWSLRSSVTAAVDASEQVGKIAKPEDPTVQKVAVQQAGVLTDAADGAVAVFTTAGITAVLMFFMLASGRLFYEKLVRVLPTMTEKKRAIRVVHTVEREVSRYLFTITAINLSLGAVIATILWSIGMPNPILWGVMAAALNFIPYVGALAGVVVVGLVALVSFPTASTAALAAGSYFLCTTIEGQLLTPALVGRRLEMNPVAVFVSIALWGWLWGIPGALMAVPFLVSLKVLCEHFDGLATLGEFLGGGIPADDKDDSDV